MKQIKKYEEENEREKGHSNVCRPRKKQRPPPPQIRYDQKGHGYLVDSKMKPYKAPPVEMSHKSGLLASRLPMPPLGRMY